MDTQFESDVLMYVHSRFEKGLAAELSMLKRGERIRLLLIPSSLFTETGEAGLAIGCEGEGLHIWNGLNPLNLFDLLCRGYSLSIASAVSELIRALFPCRRRIKSRSKEQNSRAIAQLENKTKP